MVQGPSGSRVLGMRNGLDFYSPYAYLCFK